MAAMVAVRCDPVMRAFYHRLISQGKRKKQALLAVVHKLLRCMLGGSRTSTPPSRVRPWLDKKDGITYSFSLFGKYMRNTPIKGRH